MNNYNFNQSYSRHENFMPPISAYSSPRIVSNKIYVTSLDDALNRNSERNSEMVYFHQDLNEFYVIKTDYDGRKSWAAFNYNVPNQDENLPATKADIRSLLERIERLEGKSEVTADAQLNG